jgi:hypothetical protein
MYYHAVMKDECVNECYASSSIEDKGRQVLERYMYYMYHAVMKDECVNECYASSSIENKGRQVLERYYRVVMKDKLAINAASMIL